MILGVLPLILKRLMRTFSKNAIVGYKYNVTF